MRKRTTQLSLSLTALAFSSMATSAFSQVDWVTPTVDLGDPTIIDIDLPPPTGGGDPPKFPPS